MNSLRTAGWGLTSTEHYYGIPESLYTDSVIQNFPADYNFFDEYHRFSVSGLQFLQSAPPRSEKWMQTLHEFLALGHTFVPTFNIYDANRDVMRARQADWHKQYTWGSIWKYFEPQRGGHGSYWYKWSTTNEIEWKRHYSIWMQFVNDYKNLGGRVCAGSDSGFIYQIYGFGFVRELELLQEAGFNPLEVWKAATLDGATLLGKEDLVGSIEIGKQADLLIHKQNPLADTKLMYGTGTMRLADDVGEVQWERCIETTVKSGILYDTETLLADVREMVSQGERGA